MTRTQLKNEMKFLKWAYVKADDEIKSANKQINTALMGYLSVNELDGTVIRISDNTPGKITVSDNNLITFTSNLDNSTTEIGTFGYNSDKALPRLTEERIKEIFKDYKKGP